MVETHSTKEKSPIRIEGPHLVVKEAWAWIYKILETSIFKSSLKGKSKGEKNYRVKRTYGMLLESVGNSIVKIGKNKIPVHYIQHEFISGISEKYDRLIVKEERKKIKKEAIKIREIELIKKEKKEVIERLKKIEFSGKISILNNWLDTKCPSKKFLDKRGEDYKLLIFGVIGSKNRSKLFCSKKYESDFRQFVDRASIRNEIKVYNSKDISYLQSLEKYLKKDMIKNSEFFRKIGASWVDFEAGYIVEREEIKAVKDLLEDNRLILLVGKASSGKSVLASSIGYFFHKKGWNVSFLKPEIVHDYSRRQLQNDIELFGVNNDKPLVVIEDLHRNPNKICELLEYVDTSKTRFLITTRPSYEIGLNHNKTDFIYEVCEKIILEGNFEDIADKIIKLYSINQKDERSEEFSHFYMEYDGEEIKEKANKDFWILAYLLKSWKPNEGINLELIYKQIKKDLDDLKFEFKSKYNLDPLGTIFTIAPFSIFEVGVCESFFNKNYGAFKTKPKIIEKLLEYGEIIEENGYYFIPHSTLAELYLKTILLEDHSSILFKTKNYKKLTTMGFSNKIKEFPINVIKAYIKTLPRNYGELFFNICKNDQAKCKTNYGEPIGIDKTYEETEIRLFIDPDQILMDKDLSKYFIDSLNEYDLKNLTLFLQGLKLIHNCKDLYRNKIIEFYIENINIDKHISQLNREFDENIIGKFIYEICYFRDYNDEIIEEIILKFDVSRLREKFSDQTANKLEFLLYKNIKDSLSQRFVDDFIKNIISKLKIEDNSYDYFHEISHFVFWDGVTPDVEYSKIDDAIIPRLNVESIIKEWKENGCIESLFFGFMYFGNIIYNNENYLERFIKLLSKYLDEAENYEVNCIFHLFSDIVSKGTKGIDIINEIIEKIDKKRFENIMSDKLRMLAFHLIDFPEKETEIREVFDKLNIWSYLKKVEINKIESYLEKDTF